MRWFMLILLILGMVSASYANPSSGRDSVELGQPILITSHLAAYQAQTTDGKKIIYVTNIAEDGHRMGGDLPIAQKKFRVIKTARTNSARPTIIVSRKNIESNTRPADAVNGIPICFWRGQVVSPVRMGNRLVCPSQSAAYSNGLN
jgi:hypothetical protein